MEFFTNEPLSLNAWESLIQILESQTSTFTNTTIDDYEAMDALEKHRFNTDRKAYVSGGMTVSTPQVAELIHATKTAM